MYDNSPGILSFHFVSAILLTLGISRVIVACYRKMVTRNMQLALGRPNRAEAAGGAVGEAIPPDPRPGVSAKSHPASAEARLRWRLATIQASGSIAAAAVMAAFFLYNLGSPLIPTRTFAVLYAFAWPLIPILSLTLGLTVRRALLASAAYAGLGLAIVGSLSAMMRWGFGWTDAQPLLSAVSFLSFLAVQAAVPLATILITSGRRTRSIVPLVLAGMLVFTSGNLVVGEALIRVFDVALLRGWLLSLGATGGRIAWYLLAAVPIGGVCWAGMTWVGRGYQRKAFSDLQLLVDAWWLIVIFEFSFTSLSDWGWAGLLGLSAFIAYRLTIQVALILLPLEGVPSDGPRLLLLRVFGFQRRTERLFDTVAQRWRWIGSVRMIAGADLATRLIGPGDLVSFMGGRLRQLFLGHGDASIRQLDALDERRDPDGHFRINKIYCHGDTWQPALRHLLTTTDVVLMDLRGLSGQNQGCVFELRQLAELDLIERTVFVVDNTTDAEVLAASLRAASQAEAAPSRPVNLVQTTSTSGAGLAEVQRRLRSLVDGG